MTARVQPAKRPSIDIIVPFGGEAEEVAPLRTALAGLRIGPDDAITVVDNTAIGLSASAWTGAPSVTIVRASAQRSSYYARNVGAEQAVNPWLLFMDADCVPHSNLLDAYFRESPDERCGAVAGTVIGDPFQRGFVARYARSRGHLDQEVARSAALQPIAVTANLLVRARAWADVGGFLEGIRSGGDGEFCFRLQSAGWTLEHHPAAVVEHAHRESLEGLARQMARYGAGRAWMSRRHPGAFPRPRPIRGLLRCAAGVVVWGFAGRFERAAFKAVDAVSIVADTVGYLGTNAASGLKPPTRARIAVMTDTFSELSETFIAEEISALARLGEEPLVVAGARARRPNRAAGRAVATMYLEDDAIARKVMELARLVLGAPADSLRDWSDRRRWVQEEPARPLRSLAPTVARLRRAGVAHLHVHFAAGAALDAMRIARILRVPMSITAHGYDIFAMPRNLPEKLNAASFVTSGCHYNVTYLRTLLPSMAPRIHEIVMGVDPMTTCRARPYPGGRHAVAVGRLVEKKGFADLIEAVAILRDRGLVDRLTIIGDGPLKQMLQQCIERHALGEIVVLAGGLEPEGVRGTLEGADVLVMPCVVADDGDRDSMPVVVKEAMAMEVPVVGTQEVGLPEAIDLDRGVLAPPGDPAALAEALGELLARPAAERARMGRAGRAWVLEHANIGTETARLVSLIAAASY